MRFAAALGLVLDFAVLARGAHDLWAATLVYAAIFALAAAFLVHAAWSGRGAASAFAVPIALLAGALALSFHRSINPSESWLGLMDWLACLTAFWLALSILRTPREIDAFLAVVVPALVVSALVHLYQRATIPVSYVDAAGARRDVNQFITFFVTQSWGTMVNSNLAAAFALPWLPALAMRRSRGAFWTAGLAAAALGCVFPCSAWAWLCLLLGAPLALGPDEAARAKEWLARRRRLAVGLGAGAAAALFGLVAWKLLHTRDWAGNAVSARQNVSRLLWWAAAAGMFRSSPWTGVGVGNFPSAYLAYKVGAVQNSLFAHSFPAAMAAETGLLGLSALLLLLGAVARRLLSRWSEVRRPFLAGALMLLLFSAISVSMEYLAVLLTFWVFLGAAAAPTVAADRRPRKSVALVAAGAVLAGMVSLAEPLLASRNCVAGRERLEQGRVEDALRAFAGAAELDSRSYEARRGLAAALHVRYLAARDPRDLDAAVAHQYRAIALNRLDAVLRRELDAYLAERKR